MVNKVRFILLLALILPNLTGFCQGSFNCPDTLHVQIDPLICEWEVEDFSYLSQPDNNALLVQTPLAGTVLDLNQEWDFEVTLTLSSPGLSELECTFVVRVTPESLPGDDNVWTASCYNGKKIYNQEVYRGYYSNEELNIVSWWLWDTGASPSAFSEYQGCTVNDNQHTVSYSRTGFPCAEYALDILNHDNEVQIFIDGQLVFEDFGFNQQHYSAYEGFLDETSTVTFEWNEGIGGSLGILDFRMICPTDTIVQLDQNCNAIMPDFTYEPCEGGNVVQSINPGTPLTPGIFPVSLYTSDINGQQDSCSFNLHVLDQSPPEFDCPNDVELQTNINCEAVVPDFSYLQGLDNCDGSTNVNQSIEAGEVIYENSSLVLTSQDASGNQTECEIQLLLVDTVPPNYPCPENDIIIVNEDCSWNMPNYTFLRFPADNCSSDFFVTQTPSPGTSYNSAQNIEVQITVEDQSGNQTLCNFLVQAYDLNTPEIHCIEDQEIEVSNMCNTEVPDFTSEISYSGTCSQVELIQTPAAGTPILQSGEPILVQMEAQSVNGTTASCSFTYTVIDNTEVNISCENSTVVADENCQVFVPDLSSQLLISGECAPSQITQTPALGELVEINDSPIEIEFTVTDVSGNASSCISLLTIEDITPPIIACSEEVYEAFVDSNGSYFLNDFTSEVTADESCSAPVSITQLPLIGEEIIDLGNLELEFLVQDNAGNESQCQVTLMVIDSIAPSITQTNALEIVLDASCGFIMPDFIDQFDLADNHSEELIFTQTPIAGTYVNSVSFETLEIQVEDESGNQSTHQSTLTLIDSTSPALDCPESLDLFLNENCSAVMPNMQEFVTVEDNCSASLTHFQSIEFGSILNLNLWPGEVMIELTDESLNSAQCSVLLLPVDSIAPQIICPTGGAFNANNTCTAALNLGQPEVSDFCSEVNYSIIEGTDPNGIFEIGDYTTEYMAVDSYGNSSNCMVSFSVNDSTPPEITCVQPIELSLEESCEIAVPNMSPQVSDVCSESTWFLTNGPAQGDFIGIGSYNLVYSAQDEAGNTAQCSTELTVMDLMEPELICSESQQVNALEDLCGAPFEFEIEASDNCSFELIQLSGEMSGAFLNLGVHHFEFEASDPSQNTATCSFQVEVIDTTSPTIDCIDTLFISSTDNSIQIPQATDACGLVEVTPIGTWPPDYPLNPGVNEFEFIAVDEAGNLATCLTTVQMNAPPIARTDQITSFKKTETINALENDEDPDGPYVILNHTEYPPYVVRNIDDSFTIYLEDLNCVIDTFTYEIRDLDGLTAIGMVIINPICPYSIELPQIFTPNGDGSNDFFVIEHLEDFKENELQVFNEAGQRVFHQINYQNSWDGKGNSAGTFGSGRVPQGTYYVILHLAALESPLKGALTIVY